jgi:hypothetical protein
MDEGKRDIYQSNSWGAAESNPCAKKVDHDDEASFYDKRWLHMLQSGLENWCPRVYRRSAEGQYLEDLDLHKQLKN